MIPLDIVTLTPEENNTSLIAAYAKDADFISINKYLWARKGEAGQSFDYSGSCGRE